DGATSSEGGNRLGEAHEIFVGHAHRVVVRASVEQNFLIPCQRFIDVNRQVVESAEGRHSAQFAIREKAAEFFLGGQTHGLSDNGSQFVELDVFGTRQNRQNRFLSVFAGAEHHGFGDLFA